jgi:fructose-bisphosphate aldolase class II
MEIIQGIADAAKSEHAPLILQVSAGARKYAKHIYLVKLVEYQFYTKIQKTIVLYPA